ncbi:MalY/PatB family protein [Marinitenerispora sediminis]|uniref:cysteine-S-conjugate beta-lyase n=1 Tax=Marinitenerispora sediminis TaxID=1931232 RepID=A0A368T0I6_9ACTN|nr:aminotransferase class I/II-fold pyridoxal phosphate-dependent enzyme [Marinitenerispora sediminis]RCV48368.1 cystathionine beta-lyase [Marinitenerispora sediminis]RCV49761.1 cystathionine beta-lyase [Marinitenerispora sediminis]RCV52563.1 cystathionine beta-lyase [Marinitenerispora sediminis]
MSEAANQAPHEDTDEGRADPFVRLSLERLRERTSMKWRTYPEDVLPLWVAEMDVPLAAAVAEALHRAVDLGDTGYPHGSAYAEALAAFAAARWRWGGLRVADTAIVPDVMMGIVEILRLITGPGDTVVVCSPVYPPFYAFVSHAGRNVVEARLGPDLRVDLDALEDAFVRARRHGRRAAFLMSNPHNPTGVVHTRAELEAIAALARAHGVRVVSDEIHAPLVLPGAVFTPFLSVSGSENGFALASASKAWNLAGLKAALALAGTESAAELRQMPEEVGHGPSHLGVIAHTAAFRDGVDWLDGLLLGLDANRSLLGRLVREHLPGVGYTPPQATYLAWLDCTGTELYDGASAVPGAVSDLAGPAKVFLDEARVALSSGHVFGSGGAGWVRLNFATSPAILRAALARMGRVLASRGRPPRT